MNKDFELRGIDSTVFSLSEGPKVEAPITGLNSKRDLLLTVRDDVIVIQDKKNKRLMFKAWRDGEIYQTSVRTKGFLGDENQRHPDLFAADLIRTSIQFFEQSGSPIRHWVATWENNLRYESSDNWSQFVENLKPKKPEDCSKEELIAAAQKTWNGKLAALLDFTSVTAIYLAPDEKGLSVTFSKP